MYIRHTSIKLWKHETDHKTSPDFSFLPCVWCPRGKAAGKPIMAVKYTCRCPFVSFWTEKIFRPLDKERTAVNCELCTQHCTSGGDHLFQSWTDTILCVSLYTRMCHCTLAFHNCSFCTLLSALIKELNTSYTTSPLVFDIRGPWIRHCGGWVSFCPCLLPSCCLQTCSMCVVFGQGNRAFSNRMCALGRIGCFLFLPFCLPVMNIYIREGEEKDKRGELYMSLCFLLYLVLIY